MEEKEVVIKRVDIPFWNLVWFLVKLAFASIPAMIIIYFIFYLLGVIFSFLMFPMIPMHHMGP